MANIKKKIIETNEVDCHNIDDLSAAIKIISQDLEEDEEFELTIELTLPGIGKKLIRLLDEVPIKVKWTIKQEEY